MVDWMIEVLCSYKCKEQTFFLSVNFMDRYLENHPDSMEPENIHLLGISAMFLAAKYEEIYPPYANDFVYITDNAYSKE